MPAAIPPVIFVPPTAGAPPAAAGAVFEPAPVGQAMLVIAGTTATSGSANGPVVYAGLSNNRPAWSTNGTLVAGAANTIVDYTGTAWRVSRGSVYSATRTSAAASPAGLTAWTMTTGTGSPTVTAFAVAAPPAIT